MIIKQDLTSGHLLIAIGTRLFSFYMQANYFTCTCTLVTYFRALVNEENVNLKYYHILIMIRKQTYL